MGTTRFHLRVQQVDKEGESRIELFYSIGGSKAYFNTGKRLSKTNWNQESQTAVYIDKETAKKMDPLVDFPMLKSSAEVKKINIELASLKNRVQDIEKRFELNRQEYTPQSVKDALQAEIGTSGKKSVPSKFLYDYIDRYIEDNRATRVKGSLTVYSSLKKHLQDYEGNKKIKIEFKTVDRRFFNDFQTFLLFQGGIRRSAKGTKYNKRGLNKTTVAKQLSTLKTFLSYAKADDIPVNDKYKEFKIEREDGPVIALTEKEFQSLYTLVLPEGSTQDHVRNAFCFSCVTGLRYSDLAQLRRENINEKENKIEINIIKKKETKNHTIPLNPISRAILKKYEGKARPLHVISNQRMNDYLKGSKKRKIKSICEMAGITDNIIKVEYKGAETNRNNFKKYELIGVHNGRKTFCTLALERGMSTQAVMATSGHKDYKSFQRYVNITEQSKQNAMSKAWG